MSLIPCVNRLSRNWAAFFEVIICVGPAEQFAKGAGLEKSIRENLKRIGYEF
jgi:hypothetical protein